MPQQFPICLFHREEAPEGKVFMSQETLPSGEGWVDTPAAFEPGYVRPEPAPDAMPSDEFVRRAGKPILRFPAHFYRKNDPDHPFEVRNAKEYEALDKELYRDTPDPKAWADDADPLPGNYNTPPVATKPGQAPDNLAMPLSPLNPDQQAKLWGARVQEIVVAVDGMTLEQTKLLADAEALNPANPRKTVLAAIKARQLVLKNTVAE